MEVMKALNKRVKVFLLLLGDVLAINASALLSFYLHFEGKIPEVYMESFYHHAPIVTLITLIVYRNFGLYKAVWEYASLDELLKVFGAVTTSILILVGYVFFRDIQQVYYGMFVSIYLMQLILIMFIRFNLRIYRLFQSRRFFIKNRFENKILIIGSGSTASLIANEIKSHTEAYGEVVGFLDDDERKRDQRISGVKVIGNFHDIGSVVFRYGINEIIVAVPTVSEDTLRFILEEAKRTSAKVRISPGIREVIDGQVSLSKIRDVQIDDLLGRKTVNLSVPEVVEYMEGKIVMITGGGGSIGSEICRQIARFNPRKLIILDIYENSAYEIQNELIRDYGSGEWLDVIIASVTDREKVFAVIHEEQPDIIFHAAAHKHVPLMERSPNEAIKNNVFGTKNVAEAAHECGVERFVMISTDKAVNPTNIMGASKRICEILIQGLDQHSATKFTAVRFGNVLGSNGSVVPLFRKQIRQGGPVTVTHRDIIRYFMTIEEATQLVIQSGAMARGGEIFVLDMGKPVKIYDLAVDMIKLSGLKLGEDIDIEIIGLRPGEKLYEELLMDEEGLRETSNKKIRVGQPVHIEYDQFLESINDLSKLLSDYDVDSLIEKVQKILPNYRNNSEVNQEKIDEKNKNEKDQNENLVLLRSNEEVKAIE